ncbi:MAG: iron-sulfur cluster assembly scaffold protein [Anaerovoracaceae bacterium]
MESTKQLEKMCCVKCSRTHGSSPIPQEGEYSKAVQLEDISGFSHSVATCGLKQGACKLSLNIKKGIIEEALIETVGCSGMTHSAAMASEIMPGKTLIEAMNTDLVCDAINEAMREFVLAMCYGRTQTAYSKGGLAIGSGLEDLGSSLRSQVGTSYGTTLKGPRYMELTEGYVIKLGLDENDEIIGYTYVDFGRMMNLISEGASPDEAFRSACGEYGRFSEAVKIIDPRRE